MDKRLDLSGGINLVLRQFNQKYSPCVVQYAQLVAGLLVEAFGSNTGRRKGFTIVSPEEYPSDQYSENQIRSADRSRRAFLLFSDLRDYPRTWAV